MANRKAVKAPPTKPQDSDSDGVPDLISDSDDSSDDEPRPRRAPPVSTKAPPAPPVAPVPAAAKPKPTPVPPPADEFDSSDEESVAGEETEADKKKKKKKPKKKKPKKKSIAADADGSSSPATSSSSAQNGVVPPPVVKAAVEPVPAAPVKVVDPEEEKRKLVEAAFRTKWQSVIAAVADVRKKLNLKNNKTSSLNTLEDLSFSWAAQKFEYDVIEERTQEERRYQEACADVIAEGTTEEVFDDSDLYEDDGQALLFTAEQKGRTHLWRFDLPDRRAEVVAEGGTMPTPAMQAWARELQIGAWFELDYRGKQESVQLAWSGLRQQLLLFVTPAGRGILFQLHRLAAFLQAGLLVPQEDESLTTRATRAALAKIDADPTRLLN